MGKSTISMVIFHSYISLPEGVSVSQLPCSSMVSSTQLRKSSSPPTAQWLPSSASRALRPRTTHRGPRSWLGTGVRWVSENIERCIKTYYYQCEWVVHTHKSQLFWCSQKGHKVLNPNSICLFESQFRFAVPAGSWHTRCIFIASELCEGGELFNAMIEDGPHLPAGASMEAGHPTTSLKSNGMAKGLFSWLKCRGSDSFWGHLAEGHELDSSGLIGSSQLEIETMDVFLGSHLWINIPWISIIMVSHTVSMY